MNVPMGFKSRTTKAGSSRTTKARAGSKSKSTKKKPAKSAKKPAKSTRKKPAKSTKKPAKSTRKPAKSKAVKASGSAKIVPLRETIRGAIEVALENTGSLRQAARALDMPYSSLRDKLDQLGIDAPGRPSRRR